jgi:hypothetical protein
LRLLIPEIKSYEKFTKKSGGSLFTRGSLFGYAYNKYINIKFKQEDGNSDVAVKSNFAIIGKF